MRTRKLDCVKLSDLRISLLGEDGLMVLSSTRVSQFVGETCLRRANRRAYQRSTRDRRGLREC